MDIYTIEQLGQQYQQLLSEYYAGRISYQQLADTAQHLKARDNEGYWWAINLQEGGFLRYDGQQWISATPSTQRGEQQAEERPAMSEYTVWCRKDASPWQELNLSGDIAIGRSQDSQLRLEDGAVSRRHAVLSVRSDGAWLTDLGSSNGTIVDDQRINANTPVNVYPGQLFAIGDTTFMITATRSAGAGQRRQPQQQQAKRASQPVMHAKKKGGAAGWLAVVMVGGGLLSCVCVVAVGAVLLMSGLPGDDLMATQIAFDATQMSQQILSPTQPVPTVPGAVPTPLPVIPPGEPTAAPPVDTEQQKQTWLIMIYSDAEDDVLEGGLYLDLNEAEVVGSNDRVQIVTQIDRYDGALDWDGDWTSTKRFLLGEDYDLTSLQSPELQDLGELDMSDTATLVDFVMWAISSYPADKHVLILSDHGDGWPGGWYDDDPNYEGHMAMNEIDDALAYIVSQSGIGQFEIIGFDACLMGQLEVYSAVAPYAQYAVASEEVEPFLGWAYAGFLGPLKNNPDMSGADLASIIVNSYIDEDQVVHDNDVRNMIFEGATADDVKWEKGKDATLSAVDLAMLQGVNSALDNLVAVLRNVDQASVAEARTYAQAFENVFSEEMPSPNIDLAHFARLLVEETGNPEVSAAVDQLLLAVDSAVIAEKHGPERPGATGISIYFPTSDLYVLTYDDTYDMGYTTIANRFTVLSQWDEFLEFHYTW